VLSEKAPSSHRFAAHGIELVVHDWGGTGEPVLLAHPTGFHGRVWSPVAARLRDEIKELKHELRGMQAAGV